MSSHARCVETRTYHDAKVTTPITPLCTRSLQGLRILKDDSVMGAEWRAAIETPATTPTKLSEIALRHFNGYEQQQVMQVVTGDESYNSMLAINGSPHVGRANVFVSWALGSELNNLITALERWLKDSGNSPEETFFWVR